VYCASARDNARQKIYLDDADRHDVLESLAAVARRAEISTALVSQIQTAIERDGFRGLLKALAENYKVKA
jgi:hypothetical protein